MGEILEVSYSPPFEGGVPEGGGGLAIASRL